jgi:hypothetical protein
MNTQRRKAKIGHRKTTQKNKNTTRPFRKAGKKRRRGRSTKFQSKTPASIVIKGGVVTMRLPRRLRSYNQRGGHWSEFSDRQAWANLLATTTVTSDGSITLPVKTRMRLDLIRLAPSKRYLLDKDNLSVSGKRLTDALVKAGYLIDDDRTHLDGAYVVQGLSRDKKYWTLVQLKEAAAYVDNVQTVDPMLWNLRDIQNVQELGPREVVVDPLTEASKQAREALSILRSAAVNSADEHTDDPGASRRRAVLRGGTRGHAGLSRESQRSQVLVLSSESHQVRHGVDRLTARRPSRAA